MLEIELPQKPTKLSPPKYPPLTKEEREEVDFINRRKEKWNIFFSSLYFIIILIIIGLYYYHRDKSSTTLFGVEIPEAVKFALYMGVIFGIMPLPIGLLISMRLSELTIEHLSFLKPSKRVQNKLRNEFFRQEEDKQRQKEIRQYDNSMKLYNQNLERIRLKYPGIQDFNYNFELYSQKVADEFSKKFPDIVNKTKLMIENGALYEDWITCTDREFEIKTAKWYMLCGYKVRLTSKSNDGGVDVIAKKDDQSIYIQCKQYKNSHVPVSVARELLGVMASDKIEKGAIVCVMGGDKGTVSFSKRNNIDIITIDTICKDIKSRVAYMTDKVPFQMTKIKDNIYLYQGYGIYEVLCEPFSDLNSLIAKVKSLENPNNYDEISVILWHGIYFAIRYKNFQKRIIIDNMISHKIDPNTFTIESVNRNIDSDTRITKTPIKTIYKKHNRTRRFY